MKHYLEITLLSDFKLMAHLALRPEEFADQVQFGGKETDSQEDGKQSQSRSGGYFLDPLFKERLALLRFRLSKFLPDAPKEVELTGEMDLVGLPPQIVNILVQVAQQSKINSASLEIPSSSAKASAPIIPTSNGSVISCETVALLTNQVKS